MIDEDKEKLEGWLIDRALGEIPAEDRARLDEALAREGELRQRARQIEETVGLAKSALASGDELSADTLPPLPLTGRGGRRGASHPWPTVRRLVPLAACLVVGLVLWALLWQQPTAIAQMGPIEVIPQSIELTVFSEPKQQVRSRWVAGPQAIGGYQRVTFQSRRRSDRPEMTDRGPKPGLSIGLIRDHRLILNLRQGDNIVRFANVSAGIIPTSVRFVSDTDPEGTKVVEQNFEFDLASADTLLKRYIDKKISCLGKDGSLEEGFLASFDSGNIVLSEKIGSGQTFSLTRQNLLAIRLDKLPEGLVSRPTLVWKLRAQKAGRHETTLSYLTNDIVWRADYIVRLTDENLLDLKGWVTITNQSGGAYRDAKLKLIAGDVHTVVEEPERLFDRIPRLNLLGRTELAEPKEFKEKAFFEYHLYTLSAPSTVNDNQIKQLSLLAKRGIRGRRVFFYRAWQGNQKVDVQLRFKNDKQHNLGMPLPKGKLRFLQADSDGELHQVGEDSIDHTPKDEDVELTIGQAFNVVGERAVTSQRRPTGRTLIQDVKITLRNHKNQAIKAIVEDKLNARAQANWKITAKSDEFAKEDFQTIRFEFDVPANSQKVITYSVRYDW